MTRADLLYDFRHLRLRFQRQARFIRRAVPFPLPATSSVLLSILRRHSDYTASDLCHRLSISKFRAARLLMSMEEKGYIVRSTQTEDQRFNQIKLTAAGEKLLQAADELDATVGEGILLTLDANEREQFISFMRRVATGLGAEDQLLQPGEHPLFLEQRRLVEATGTITENYMDTGYPIATVQVFLDIERFGPLSFKELSRALPFEATHISRIVSQLETEGLISKANSSRDGRSIIIRFTEDGKRHYDSAIARQLDQRHKEALKHFSDAELEQFCDMLRRIDAADKTKLTGALTLTQICNDEPSRVEARAFLVEELVRKNQHHNLPDCIISRSSFCTVYRAEGRISALFEANSTGRSWVVSHVLIGQNLAEEIAINFLRESLLLLASSSGGKRVRAGAEVLDEEIVKLWQAAQGRTTATRIKAA